MAQLNTRVVLRNDTAGNWTTADADAKLVLLKGEIGIEYDTAGKVKMKVGDGATNWSALPYFGGEEANVYQVNSFEELPTEDVSIGDTGIVKSVISGDKNSYTGYVYTEAGWAAMDGNYNADNVYFDEDFVFTTKIGTVQTLENGSTTVAAAGKNVKEFFAGLFAAEEQPEIVEPSYSLSASATLASNAEIGNYINGASWDGTWSAGSYEFGSKESTSTSTGITATYSMSQNIDAQTSTALDGSVTFNSPVQIDSVGEKVYAVITGVCTYEASPYTPVTNIGNDATAGAIQGNTISKSANVAVTGIRNSFYGSKASPVEATSANIRALTAKNATNSSLTVSVVDGAKQVIIAVPSNRKVTKVADENAFGTDIFGSFTPSVVSVGGADATAESVGNFADNYNVYIYTPSAALSANTYKVTVANM